MFDTAFFSSLLKNKKFLYLCFIVFILQGLRFVFLIFERQYRIAYLIEIIFDLGLAIYVYSLIKNIKNNN